MIFWGRGDRIEPPPERRQVRRIPRVLGSSFRLVWEAAPGRFLTSLAPQIVTAITTGAQLVITRDLIAAVLATGSGGDLGRVGTLLGEMIGLSLISSAAGLVQNQQQSMLSAIVERHTNSVLLDRIIAIDLKRFETPEFQDLLRRAMNAMGRMMGVTGSAIGLARSLFLIIGVAAALYILQPILLVLAIVGFVPMWLASAASSRQTYHFWRSMTPNERKRNYIFGLFTSREYAKELRAFALAPYMRALEASLFLEDWEEFNSLAPARAPALAERAAPFDRIDLDHVSFRYPPSASKDGGPALPSRLALDDVSLEIRAGEVIALVGENGSGKTTLAKVLSGLYRPDSGRMLWDGEDVAAHDQSWIYERVAVLFQDFARFMLTVRENIGLGRVENLEDLESIIRSAERAGADSFVNAWPDTYDTVLGPYFMGGKDVSIGQWQRIALARAFFRDAPLVILDEPTAALDARAEHDLFTRMRDLFSGRSVLLISHRFSSVRSADRIYVLHEGRVVENGTHDELMHLGGRYAELFTMQASAYLAPTRERVAP